MNKRHNLKYTYEIVKIAVEQALCYADVIRNLGAVPQAGNFENIKNRIKEYNLDTAHFLTPGEITKLRLKEKKRNYFEQKPLDEILVISLTRYDHRKLKKRLYAENLKKEECELCGQGPVWKGKPMTLRLDHINGENTDYRIDNLRILCPNCDSTQETFCSGNRKNRKTDEIKTGVLKSCLNCGDQFKSYNKKNIYCNSTCRKKRNNKINKNYTTPIRKRKVERPPLEQLKSEIKELGYRGTGRKYGVSDNAVRKWTKIKE